MEVKHGHLVIPIMMNVGGSSVMRVNNDDYLWFSTNDNQRTDLEWVNNLGFDDWIKIKYGKVDDVTKEKIWIGCMGRSSLCECKAYEHKYKETTLDIEQNQLRKETSKESSCKDGTSSDDDDTDGIMDYLELQGTEGFTDPDDKIYEQRRCKLLGLQYK